VTPEPRSAEEALEAKTFQLADELRAALDDPQRHVWGGPWEHLGDAEKDVRLLLAGIALLRSEIDRLRGIERQAELDAERAAILSSAVGQARLILGDASKKTTALIDAAALDEKLP
jgi:hypothetical protein